MSTSTKTQQKTNDSHQQQTAPAQPIARLAPSRLPIVGSIAKEFDIDANQWRVLVDQIFPNAKTVEAIGMAVSYCRARKLDIFKRPVHIVPMWSSVLNRMVETVWPGISEIRTTAHRTGEYGGIDAVQFGEDIDAEFEGHTGRNDENRIAKSVRFPEWASVTVYRWVKGQKAAFNALVYWEEIYATIGKTDVPNEMWAKRPRGQLMKCVEAAALRMAFPEELGNVYAAEEMEGRVIEGNVNAATAIPTEPDKQQRQQPPTPPEPPTGGGSDPAAKDPGEPSEPPVGQDDASGDAFSLTHFLERLEEDMLNAGDEATVHEVWEHHDVANTLGLDIDLAEKVRDRALDRIRRAAAITAGQDDMFGKGDDPTFPGDR